MKVYVDELPKSCEECPMCRSGKLKLQRKGRYVEAEQCVFGQYKYQTMEDEIDTCPLQSLTDYTKQVIKEVCEILEKRIIKYLDSKNNYRASLDVHSIIQQVIKEDLDQIQEDRQ